MAKKREISDFADDTLSTPANEPETLGKEILSDTFLENPMYSSTSSVVNTPALQALLDSGIIEIVDGGIIWREGHLEHVRAQYASDPALCQRDYANELEAMRENGVAV